MNSSELVSTLTSDPRTLGCMSRGPGIRQRQILLALLRAGPASAHRLQWELARQTDDALEEDQVVPAGPLLEHRRLTKSFYSAFRRALAESVDKKWIRGEKSKATSFEELNTWYTYHTPSLAVRQLRERLFPQLMPFFNGVTPRFDSANVESHGLHRATPETQEKLKKLWIDNVYPAAAAALYEFGGDPKVRGTLIGLLARGHSLFEADFVSTVFDGGAQANVSFMDVAVRIKLRPCLEKLEPIVAEFSTKLTELLTLQAADFKSRIYAGVTVATREAPKGYLKEELLDELDKLDPALMRSFPDRSVATKNGGLSSIRIPQNWGSFIHRLIDRHLFEHYEVFSLTPAGKKLAEATISTTSKSSIQESETPHVEEP